MWSGNLWTISGSYSLLLRTNSLFFHKNSLFCCVGNFTASHWICPCPGPQIRCGTPNLTKFPVNFPVSREFGEWRPVRLGLRPPPRSLAIWHVMENCHLSPPLAGFFVVVFPFLCSGARRRLFSGRRLRPEKSRSWRETNLVEADKPEALKLIVT